MQRAYFAAALVALAACGGATTTATPEPTTFEPGTITVAPHLEGALQRAAAATAAIRMAYDYDASGKPLLEADGTPLVASCGATFIDAHHAITAGHCVTGQVADPENRPIEADIIDVTGVLPWQKTTTLTGLFPAYEHPRLTEADGYVVHALTCHLVASCFGTPIDPALSTHCPVEAMPSAGADVALLRCDEDLPAGHGSLPIATRPIALGDAVTYFWFHELYFASPDSSSDGLTDFDAHYLHFDEANPGANFHYHGWDSNQLLPLASKPFVVDGRTVPQSVLALDEQSVMTDHFGCHGSSGSGGLRLDPATGEYELVGPAATFAATSDPGALCPGLVEAGRPNLAFSPPAQVLAIAALR